MFIPTINVKRPDGTSFSVVGRMYKHPQTSKTFHICQHPEGQAGILNPQLVAIMLYNWPSVLEFLKWVEANADG